MYIKNIQAKGFLILRLDKAHVKLETRLMKPGHASASVHGLFFSAAMMAIKMLVICRRTARLHYPAITCCGGVVTWRWSRSPEQNRTEQSRAAKRNVSKWCKLKEKWIYTRWDSISFSFYHFLPLPLSKVHQDPTHDMTLTRNTERKFPDAGWVKPQQHSNINLLDKATSKTT